MDILIFDLDGVLLKPHGYHKALQETVNLAGKSIGFGEAHLTDKQIAQFEALGISSEWHSSALCMAVMSIQKQVGINNDSELNQSSALQLDGLFNALSSQPMKNSALTRGIAAIDILAAKHELSTDSLRRIVFESESIELSPTLNWFQELILGSDRYKEIYQKDPQFQKESYLNRFDKRLIRTTLTEEIILWAEKPGHGVAIMTNRPSNGPSGFHGAPDAEMGALLVGFEAIPLVGYGEIDWLAKESNWKIGKLSKPGWAHALTAILAASGWTVEKSLDYVNQSLKSPQRDGLEHLQNSVIFVFEDTPGGIIAVQEAGILLREIGLKIEVQKIGIAEDSTKRSALSSQGAIVYPDINTALVNLNYFRALSSN